MIGRRTADRLAVALAAAGLLISGYLTLLHYDSDIPLVCSAGSFVNCESVLTSPSATLLGVPVAVWGLAWFAIALAMTGTLLRADFHILRRVSFAWTGAAAVGVMYLVYQEIGVIGKICAWCTAVHAIIIAMLLVRTAGDQSV